MENSISSHGTLIRQYVLTGMIVGLLYGLIEYFVKLGSTDEQLLIPLLMRAVLAGLFVTLTAAIFEIKTGNFFVQKPFYYIVLARAIFYSFAITFWLSLINAVSHMLIRDMSFSAGLIDYLTDDSYLFNLILIFLFLISLMGAHQINSLHKKGELINFIVGKYHRPREVIRIFCFIDLKNSTSIAETLGHIRFADFLKDYYSDITEALIKTQAEIYQYVGDEIVLCWPVKNGLKMNNALRCFFLMKRIMQKKKEKYMAKFGVHPAFRAGLHGGKVIVTWVGEIKREIVYIGDVLNTAARLQEDCKRLEKDLLISQELLDQFRDLTGIEAHFIEESKPRGKAEKVRLYSLEEVV